MAKKQYFAHRGIGKNPFKWYRSEEKFYTAEEYVESLNIKDSFKGQILHGSQTLFGKFWNYVNAENEVVSLGTNKKKAKDRFFDIQHEAKVAKAMLSANPERVVKLLTDEIEQERTSARAVINRFLLKSAQEQGDNIMRELETHLSSVAYRGWIIRHLKELDAWVQHTLKKQDDLEGSLAVLRELVVNIPNKGLFGFTGIKGRGVHGLALQHSEMEALYSIHKIVESAVEHTEELIELREQYLEHVHSWSAAHPTYVEISEKV